MDEMNILSIIMDNLVLPVIVVISTILINLLKTYLEKVSQSAIKKNNISRLDKEIDIKKKLIDQIESLARSAVLSNMQLAEKLKEDGNGLTKEQARDLKESAKIIVLNSIPMNMNIDGEDVTLESYFGSKENLESLVGTLIEKAVYQNKVDMIY